jgi:hypothetical protein
MEGVMATCREGVMATCREGVMATYREGVMATCREGVMATYREVCKNLQKKTNQCKIIFFAYSSISPSILYII